MDQKIHFQTLLKMCKEHLIYLTRFVLLYIADRKILAHVVKNTCVVYATYLLPPIFQIFYIVSANDSPLLKGSRDVIFFCLVFWAYKLRIVAFE